MSRPLDELFQELSGPATPLGPTDWPEPAAVRRKSEHRRTVRRASVASAVAVVIGVAVAIPATIAGSHRAPVTPANTTSPAVVHHAAPAPVPVPNPSPVTHDVAVPTGPRTNFGKFSLVIPTGWDSTLITDGRAWGQPKQSVKGVCFVPPGQPDARSMYGCKGLAMYYGSFLPGAGTAPYDDQTVSRKNVPSWQHGTVAPTCPVAAGASTGAQTVGGLGGPLKAFLYPFTGNARPVYNAWQVSCADGTSFQPRAWYYPKSHVVFFLFDDNPQAQALLATFHRNS